jgi:hypothetical protein
MKAKFSAATKAARTDSIDWSGLISIVSPYLDHAFTAGANASADDLNVKPFNQLNEAARDYAQTRGAELVGMKYNADGDLVENPNARWAITDTTRDRLRGLEQEALEEGWTPDELAAAVNDLIDDAPRALMIARTDLAKAQTSGSIAEWRASGVVRGKVWLLSNDHDFDDECDDNDAAGVIPLDEDFPSGDDTSPAHPRCDCDVAAEVDDGEDSGDDTGEDDDASTSTTLFFE